MRLNISSALDKSLALLETGQATLEECATRYPKHAVELRPLLEAALEVRGASAITSSPTAFAAGKRRMLKALAEKRQRQVVSSNLLRRCVDWLIALFGGKWENAVQRHKFAFQVTAATAMTIVLLAVVGSSLLSWIGETVTRTTTLAQVEGAVEFMPASNETWQPASPDTQIEAGGRIRAGLLSNATLVFFDGSTVELGPETEMTIVETSGRRDGGERVIVLHQQLGQTYSWVQPLHDLASRFEIETPAAAVAVRGTEFAIAVDPDGTTSVVVTKGLVEVVGQEGTVAVRAGEQTVVRPGRPPVQPALTLTPPLWATPQPPGLTKTPQPPGLTKTPQPPGLTKTPQPPGLTETPQPPGLTKTPQPPGLTKTPQPPDQAETPQPPGLTKTPQPPGLTKTPQPPGLTKTPQPPSQEKPPKPTKRPKPEKP